MEKTPNICQVNQRQSAFAKPSDHLEKDRRMRSNSNERISSCRPQWWENQARVKQLQIQSVYRTGTRRHINRQVLSVQETFHPSTSIFFFFRILWRTTYRGALSVTEKSETEMEDHGEQRSKILRWYIRGNCQMKKLVNHVLKRSHVSTSQVIVNRVLARQTVCYTY